MSIYASVQSIEAHSADGCYERYVVLAGSRIRSLRCTARSGRTKQQCGKPAIKSSRTQKCATHGGRGHTADALARIAKAHTSHGQTTKAAKEQSRMDSAMLREMEDALHFLGIAQGPKTRGRKPAGYKPVRTQADLARMFKERFCTRCSRSLDP